MIERVIVMLTILIHISLGLYIKPLNESKAIRSIQENNSNDMSEWKMFKKMLNLTDKKVELLKSQKDQQETKNLLYRFIRENPRLINANNNKIKVDKLKKFQTNTQQTNNVLKPLRKNELKNKPQKELKQPIHMIAVKENFDMSSVKFCQLLKLFLMKKNRLSHSNDINDDKTINHIPKDDQPIDNDKLHNFICDDTIIFYKNDCKLDAEFSMQDLIFQAVYDYWRQDMEERKLMNNEDE
uniref:Uncharacterized protein n=1 Tax=Glossina brevipalpis TaxID=37001 RepID=A0A1A9WTR7_9MUSC